MAAHPALAKQLSGIVSQQNTLDRQLTVWENLYFHGRLFGMGAKRVPAGRRRAARAVPADQVGQGVGVRAVRRDGAAADGGPRDLPPAVGAVPRRADGGPRPAEPARAVGPARRAAPRRPDDPADDALHGGSGPALRAGRHHGPRQDPRPRHPGRAEAEHRRRHGRHGEGRRRRWTGSASCSPARSRASPAPGRPDGRGRAARAGRRPAASRASSRRPSAAGSTSSTCRSPSRAWRRCSST